MANMKYIENWLGSLHARAALVLSIYVIIKLYSHEMAKFTYTRLISTKLLILFTHVYTHFLRICKNIHLSMINFSFPQSLHSTYTLILIIGGNKLCDLFQHTILCIIVISNNDNTQWLFLTSLSLFRVQWIEKLSGSTHTLSYPDYNQLCFTSLRPLRIPSYLDSIHKHNVQSRAIENSSG